MTIEQYEQFQRAYTWATFHMCFTVLLIVVAQTEGFVLLAAGDWLLWGASQVASAVAGGLCGAQLYDVLRARAAVAEANKHLFDGVRLL